jgi:dTDP-4-dehydrorhamnose reductase
LSAAAVRVVVTGAGGLLGTALSRTRPEGIDLVGLRSEDADVADRARIADAIARLEPDWIVHAAAWTAVDDCEKDPERALRVNAGGTANVVEAAKDADATTIVLSSDYVFDGTKREPYVEEDATNPLSVYGRSKLAAEAEARARGGRVHVVRSQWIFGAGGRNFVDTILKAAREKPELKVVDDQRGCPTWSSHLAAGLWKLIAAAPEPGTWHMAARGAASWFEFARAIVAGAGLRTPVRPCATADFPRPARRPANSVLENRRLARTLGDFMPTWQEGLRGYLDELRIPGGHGA